MPKMYKVITSRYDPNFNRIHNVIHCHQSLSSCQRVATKYLALKPKDIHGTDCTAKIEDMSGKVYPLLDPNQPEEN